MIFRKIVTALLFWLFLGTSSVDAYSAATLARDGEGYHRTFKGWYCIGIELAEAVLLVRRHRGLEAAKNLLREQAKWGMCFPATIDIRAATRVELQAKLSAGKQRGWVPVSVTQPATESGNYPTTVYFLYDSRNW